METKEKISPGGKILHWIQIAVFGVVLGVMVQFAYSWTEPTSLPPAGNVAGPITTGVGQYKNGNLVLNAGLDGIAPGANGLIVLNGNVGIGNIDPQQKVEVEGKITSHSTLASDPGNTVVTKDYIDALGGVGADAACYIRCNRDGNVDCDTSLGYKSVYIFGGGTPSSYRDCPYIRTADVSIAGMRAYCWVGNYYSTDDGIICSFAKPFSFLNITPTTDYSNYEDVAGSTSAAYCRGGKALCNFCCK